LIRAATNRKRGAKTSSMTKDPARSIPRLINELGKALSLGTATFAVVIKESEERFQQSIDIGGLATI
jgi:hypothetical protein